MRQLVDGWGETAAAHDKSDEIPKQMICTFAITSYTTFANFCAGSFDGQILHHSDDVRKMLDRCAVFQNIFNFWVLSCLIIKGLVAMDILRLQKANLKLNSPKIAALSQKPSPIPDGLPKGKGRHHKGYKPQYECDYRPQSKHDHCNSNAVPANNSFVIPNPGKSVKILQAICLISLQHLEHFNRQDNSLPQLQSPTECAGTQ